ncbi:MAG: RDD family protein, partial [Rhodococcus sp. (in: high G+C Gram-positive bacteria)]|uniref:RDD family protein n=1 Tax=Rhodococcus sp. TaxID=1831 RepID=UPI003BB19C06
LERLDLDAVLGRLDLDAVLESLDVDALVARLDVDALVARLDVDALMGRVDVNALISRVDIDGIVGRVDVPALVERAQIDVIVSNASRGVMTRLLDAIRRQLVGVDLVLVGVVSRILRRPRETATITDGSVTGRLAGGVTRLTAFAVDVFTVSFSYGVVVAVGVFLAELFTGGEFTADHTGFWYSLGYLTFGFLYFWIGLTLTGRSIGKGLVGLRVVGRNGSPISPGQAAIRTLVFPISFILWIGLIPIVLGKRRRALHDWAAGSTVVYDWGDRPSELPAPLTDWLRRHDVDPGRPGTVPITPS